MASQFTGIFGVTVTPFTSDGTRVDEAGVGQLVDALIVDGIERIVPCGNTGEFFSLTSDERRLVVAQTVHAARGRAVVVAGVGGSPADALEQARDAARAGVDALMIHHPSHPYVTGEGLLAYCAAMADASGLPVIPYLRSPAIDDTALLSLVRRPEVVAIKYAVNDLPAFGRAVAMASGEAEVAWICGTAETWAPSFWSHGAVGFTSGLVNVTAGPSLELLDALRAGDRGRVIQTWSRIHPFEQLRARRSDGLNVSTVKEAMRQIGRPSGPVRPPSSEVGEAERAEIAAILRSWSMTGAAA